MLLPNQLTILRIILTPVFLYFFLSDDILFKQIGVLVFIIAALTDWYDGWLARKFNYITDWGKFMDPLADKILTSAAFFAFVYLGILELWMVIVIVIRDFLITILRIYSEYNEKPIVTSKLAKWKTFIQMTFLYYLITIYALLTVEFFTVNYAYLFDLLMNRQLIYFSMLLVTIITIWSGINYLVRNKDSLNNNGNN
ncbi:MAG: CDP-diacylglycerol--glycerol-3-phosphate 3-phosphatidyltransferase [Melioribacteraceae bacterium]|nr:CDP-diacylglycerol--glycerol-3-phosphate 3-phosphatidyltransferase [Melioribacteraceae bacterium]MCF8432325.1 CDP-diacylglycerol--glycerol-3-phosphate 3-phosphatidyltransferase [Melioribacteraceae bacterium]